MYEILTILKNDFPNNLIPRLRELIKRHLLF